MTTDSTPAHQQIHQHMNRLRGRMCGFIEALGLPEKQEHALIVQLKSLSYDTERDVITASEY